MNNIDIFAKAKTKKSVDTVVFEVPDSTFAETSAGSHYYTLFLSFLESLGIDFEEYISYLQEIKIDGVEFDVNTDNASSHSRNAFTRETNIRKPQNRYIKLECGRIGNVRVYINEEMDANKIRAAIVKLVQTEKEKEQAIKDRDNRRKLNMKLIAEHYLKISFFNATTLHSMRITKYDTTQCIYFRLHDGVSFHVTEKGKLVITNINTSDGIIQNEINSVTDTITRRVSLLQKAVTLVENHDPLSDELQEFVNDSSTGEINFYIDKMSTEW